jgi:hypothetical protein
MARLVMAPGFLPILSAAATRMLQAIADEAYSLFNTLERSRHWGEVFHEAAPHNIRDERKRGIRWGLTIGSDRGRGNLERLHFNAQGRQTSCDLFL